MAKANKADVTQRKVTAPQKTLATFDNPQRSATTRCVRVPGVHLRVPHDGAARLRDHPHFVCPGQGFVELKSLKLYLWASATRAPFTRRSRTASSTTWVFASKPRRCEVEGDFLVRGGIHTVVTAQYP